MLDWLKKRGAARQPRPPEPPRRQESAMSGKYLLLYTYLEDRYANTVVLTFAQIEDLIGSTLPEPARLQPAWWTTPDLSRGAPWQAWTLAHRTAVPNLLAQTVVFDRT
jgi:hypothetical protein